MCTDLVLSEAKDLAPHLCTSVLICGECRSSANHALMARAAEPPHAQEQFQDEGGQSQSQSQAHVPPSLQLAGAKRHYPSRVP